MPRRPIRHVLGRRSDLSTFVVHLIGPTDNSTAKENLRSILESHVVEARNPYGIAKEYDVEDNEQQQTQRVCCFTETPIQHITTHLEKLREYTHSHYESYGIALTKLQARRKNINPVWYIDKTPGRDWLHGPPRSGKPLTNLIEKHNDEREFHASDIAKITPFIEPMGEFYERILVGKRMETCR